MNKESANARRLFRWVQQFGLAIWLLVTAEERFAPAPSAASDDLLVLFHNEVGLIADEFGIHTPGTLKGRFDLSFSVIGFAKAASRFNDQHIQRGDVVECGGPNGERHASLDAERRGPSSLFEAIKKI